MPDSDDDSSYNELGNSGGGRRTTAGTTAGPRGAAGFWADQSFVAPSNPPPAPVGTGIVQFATNYNEAFVSVSNDGGFTWTVRPIPCSTSAKGSLDHIFPNVSVDPAGNVWAAWSDDTNVYTAESSDHGQTWTCSGAVSTGTAQAVMPWIVATSAGA